MFRSLATKLDFLHARGSLFFDDAPGLVDVFQRLLDRLLPFERQEEVCSQMGILSSAEDLILVLPENGDPRSNVCGMLLRIVRDTALCSEKYAGQFGAEFFFGVCWIAELVAFLERLTVQTVAMAAPMGQLMECGPKVVAGLEKARCGGRWMESVERL